MVKLVAAGLFASALMQAAPLAAQTGATQAVSAASAVASFYDSYAQPIWFRGGVESPAVAQLVSVLQRSAFDGFVQGPQAGRPGSSRRRAGAQRQSRGHRGR